MKSQLQKNISGTIEIKWIASLTLVLLAPGVADFSAKAAIVTKLNTVTMLANSTDWSAAPAVGDTGIFDNTLSAANALALTVGANPLSLGAIVFTNNLNGPVSIGGAVGISLNNIGTDIDMAFANNNVTNNCPLTLGANQIWNINSGRTLTVGGIIGGSFGITKQGGGHARVVSIKQF